MRTGLCRRSPTRPGDWRALRSARRSATSWRAAKPPSRSGRGACGSGLRADERRDDVLFCVSRLHPFRLPVALLGRIMRVAHQPLHPSHTSSSARFGCASCEQRTSWRADTLFMGVSLPRGIRSVFSPAPPELERASFTSAVTPALANIILSDMENEEAYEPSADVSRAPRAEAGRNPHAPRCS